MVVLRRLQKSRGVSGLARCVIPRRSPPRVCRPYPGECSFVSPGSKLLLSHLLVVFPAVTVHISLSSLPPPENPMLAPCCAVRGRSVVTALQTLGSSAVVWPMGERGCAGRWEHTEVLAQPGSCHRAAKQRGEVPLACFSARCCWSAV